MDMVKRRKGLTEPEVRFYSVQIAGAIKYMHSKGIIHRDLKMGNIFLDKHMNAKIGDFGLAALLVTGKDMHTIRRTTLCGTPNYIAPEILEKGRKGHDHMVDIWSLGIIMFVYPVLEIFAPVRLTRLRFAMLTSKPPFQSSTTDEIYRRARERDYEWPIAETSQKYVSREAKELVARMLEDADVRPNPDEIVEDDFFVCGYMPVPSDITSKLRDCPPEGSSFYERPTTAQIVEQNRRNLQDMCRSCGVGPWGDSQLVLKKVWRECAEEEQYGLTPAIPLARGIVYRPFDEIRNEQKLQGRPAAAAPPQAQFSQLGDKSEELSNLSQSAFPPKAPSGLLRAPPQSFAAQQRAQNKPAIAPGILRAPSVAEPVSRGVGSLRMRTRREQAAEQKTEEGAPAARSITRALRNHLAPSKSRAASGEAAMQQQVPQPSSSKQKAKDDRVSLFSPLEYEEVVAGTRPDDVLDRLRKLQSELERALNTRSMAILSSKDKTPSPPHIVVKWVDYTNKFGLGYILNDGGVGCILRNIPTQDGAKAGVLPPACILVHGAERHCLRKDDPSYVDRHQIVPMSEGIYFYENNGEDGLSRVRVAPESFKIPMNSDGTVGKLSAGKDIFDHRKRERIVLWKKFANYMIAYGREIEGPEQADEHALQVPTITDLAAAPSDIVTFYQRFGDVGCWMFCDGHMQVSAAETI
jgi:serine/threonine protein kinase